MLALARDTFGHALDSIKFYFAADPCIGSGRLRGFQANGDRDSQQVRHLLACQS